MTNYMDNIMKIKKVIVSIILLFAIILVAVGIGKKFRKSV